MIPTTHKRGDVRTDGFMFYRYVSGKLKRNGQRVEEWLRPEAFARALATGKRGVARRDSQRTPEELIARQEAHTGRKFHHRHKVGSRINGMTHRKQALIRDIRFLHARGKDAATIAIRLNVPISDINNIINTPHEN